jgi:hypothetical protein
MKTFSAFLNHEFVNVIFEITIRFDVKVMIEIILSMLDNFWHSLHPLNYKVILCRHKILDPFPQGRGVMY